MQERDSAFQPLTLSSGLLPRTEAMEARMGIGDATRLPLRARLQVVDTVLKALEAHDIVLQHVTRRMRDMLRPTTRRG